MSRKVAWSRGVWSKRALALVAGCHWVALVLAAVLVAMASPAQAVLVRVDFQPNTQGWNWNQVPATSGVVESYASTADPVFGSSGSDVWDTRSVAGYPNWAGNPTYLDLLDTATGVGSGVSISFTGTISGAGGTPAIAGDNVRRDYLVLLGSTPYTSAGYTISGLLPNAPTKLFLYNGYLDAGNPGLRRFDFTIDGDPTMYSVTGTGLYVMGMSDGNGQLTGTWSLPPGQGEANFAGFQLYQAPPEARNSIATGDWNAAGTWDSGVPEEALGAVVNDTHLVTVNSDGAAGYLTVNGGGKVAVADGRTLTLGSLATVDAGGEISFAADSKLAADGGTIDRLTATGSFTLDLLGAASIATYDDGGNTLTFTKQGAGVLTLAPFASNTATATTFNLAGGTLSASAMDLGGGNLAFAGGIFQYTGAGESDGRMLALETGDARFDVATAGAELTLDGTISGNGGVLKAGAGTLILANAENSYTGATAVNAGVLSIGAVADGGSPSPLGAADGNAANLVLNGGTLRYTGPTATMTRGLTLGVGAAGGIDVFAFDTMLTLSGEVPETSGRLVKAGEGTLLVETAVNTIHDGGAVSVQAGTLSVGASGSIIATTGQGRILVCDAGGQNATLSVDGGAIIANRLFMDYAIPGSNPTFNLNSGSVVLANEFVGGFPNSGMAVSTINIAGGELISNTFFTIGASCGGTNIATVNQTGGLVSATQNTGTTKGLMFSSTPGAVAVTYNLDGGVLLTSGVTNPGNVTAANQTFNFGGGTLRAANDNADFLSAGKIGNVQIRNGGAVIDTQGYAITIGNPLTDFPGESGGLTKLGDGVLTLSGANTYSGPTTISGGVLKLQGPPPVNYIGTQFDMGGPGENPFAGPISHWRQPTTAKTHDIDGDNVLGTDGYSVVHVALGSEIAATPSYLTGAGTWTGPVFGAGSGFAYVMMDDPANPDNAIQANTIYPVGNGTQFYTFTLADFAAIPGTIRLGVMIDGLDSINPNASAIGLKQVGGSLAGSPTIDTTLADYNNRQPDWLFFDISGATAGMQFALYGNQGIDAAGQRSHQITVQAVCFDSLAGAMAAGNSNILADTSAVSITAGAIFDLNNNSETIGPLSGEGDVWLGAGTLTVNAVSLSAEPFFGSISGTGGLVKTGAESLELSSVENTYTGGTLVREGTLVISSAGALPAGQSLTVGEGGVVVLSSGLIAAGDGLTAANAAAVPEPGTLVLLVSGALVLLTVARRRT